MGKVIGVGGVFMACADSEATKEWYSRVLGFEAVEHDMFAFSHSASAKAFPEGARTIFAPFKGDSDYFAPSTLPYMINLIVDDLDAVVAHCETEGVVQIQPIERHDYGSFAWIMDLDGRKVELWQPPS